MNVGDLVVFHTDAWAMKPAEGRYANPGLVLEVIAHDSHRLKYKVRWNDGRITREHDCYVKPAEEFKNA